MSDYPERISISPVHRQKRDDDFYLVDRKAFPNKGVEYVRADRIEELEAKLEKAVETLKKLHRRQDTLDTFDAVVDGIVTDALAELKGHDDE